MATTAIDSYKLLTTLKATGKDANYSAEELANAFRVAQEGSELVTVPIFEARIREIDTRFDALESTFDTRFDALESTFDARFDALESKFDARFGTVDAKFDSVDSRFDAIDAKFGSIDAKFDSLRADIKAEVKSSQTQNPLWLSGIILASNGAVIAVLARAAKLF